MSLPPESFPPDNDALLSSDDAFVAACLKLLRGELDESACKALAKLLDADADKRRLYVQLAMQTQMIGEVLALHPECDASDANDESHDPYAADIMAEVADSIRMQRHADQVAKEAADLVAQEKANSERKHQEQLALMRKGNDRPVTIAYSIPKIVAALSMAAAVGLVAWLGYAHFNPPTSSQTASDAADPPMHTEQPPTPRVVYVARVAGSPDAHWRGGSPPDHLAIGDRLTLDAGFAEVEFDNGVVSRLRGPAVFEVSGANAMRLVSGILVAEVPPQGHGFTVYAGDLTVVDHGTAFGIRRDSQSAEVHVMAGQVDALCASPGAGPTVARLEAGDAVGLEQGAGALVAVAYDPGVFPRSLASESFAWKYEGDTAPTMLRGEPVGWATNEGLLEVDHAVRNARGHAVIGLLNAFEPGVGWTLECRFRISRWSVIAGGGDVLSLGLGVPGEDSFFTLVVKADGLYATTGQSTSHVVSHWNDADPMGWHDLRVVQPHGSGPPLLWLNGRLVGELQTPFTFRPSQFNGVLLGDLTSTPTDGAFVLDYLRIEPAEAYDPPLIDR